MWMMGYTDGGDPFSGRKLRTIVPRPALGRIHGSDLINFNHHLAAIAEQNKRTDFSPHQVVVSSRWNPTPEQLEALEELYRRGTRTPSSEEIQHITAQLRKFGKIEGKNVFYWFQNHKARERQKRRRQLESTGDAANSSDHEPPTAAANNNNAVENGETTKEEEESGRNNGTSLEVEGTKNWPPSTNCSNLAEKTGVSARGAAAESCRVADSRWAHLDEQEEFRQRKNQEPNATWHMMMPPFSSSCSSSPTCNLVNSSSSTISSGTTISAQGTTHPATKVVIRGTPQYNFFYRDDHHLHHHPQQDCQEHQTLQLFPLRNDEEPENKESERSVLEAMDSNTMMSSTPYKYFEFLPLKN